MSAQLDAEMQYSWTWGDAAPNLFGHGWSGWKDMATCLEDLAKHRGTSRPVEVKIKDGRNAEQTKQFHSINLFMDYLMDSHSVADDHIHEEDDVGSLKRQTSGSAVGHMLENAGKTLVKAAANPKNAAGAVQHAGWEGFTRSLRFGTVAGKIMLEHGFNLLRIHSSGLPLEEQVKAASDLNTASAKKALELVLSLKGFYIKAAQTLTGAGQLPKEAEEEFAVLLDQCPRESFEVVRRIVESELGCSIDVVFQDFQTEAIAAASIGQVHFATLLDGTNVAVKVQYPEVEKFFEVDLKMIQLATQIVGMGDKVKEVFSIMQQQFKEEFDYTQEASVMRRIATNILPHFGNQVQIPLPLDEHHHVCKKLCVRTLCTKKVLTMERLVGEPIREHSLKLLEVVARVQGVPVEELKKLMNAKNPAQIDMENAVVKKIMNMGEVTDSQSFLLRAGVKIRNSIAHVLGCMNCGCVQPPQKIAEPLNGPRLARLLYDVHGHEIFHDGLFNSDPHAGNVLVLPDGRLGLIDYGAVMDLTEEQRTSIAKLFIAIADEDDDAVPAAFWECGFKSKNMDPRLALLLAHVFFNRGPYPPDMNRLAPKVGMPKDPDLMTLDSYLRGGKIDDIEEFPGHLVPLQRCAMVLSGIAMELGAGRRSSAGSLKPHAVRWLQKRNANRLKCSI